MLFLFTRRLLNVQGLSKMPYGAALLRIVPLQDRRVAQKRHSVSTTVLLNKPPVLVKGKVIVVSPIYIL